MKGIYFKLLILSLYSITSNISGQDRPPIIPVKISEAPVIDGILDEDVWTSGPGISGFKTFTPDYGKDVPFNTVVWVAYDEENLYYAFRCDDPEPDKIKASVDARDRIRQDDWVCVNLDSYNDHQTLYCIYSNPNGIQMDTRFAAGKEDLGMDLVWYSAGKIDSEGYSIEMKLPLKSIRFSNREPVMMAATFERHISRLSTGSTYPPLSADQAMAFLTQMQPLQYEGVKHYALLEILPSATYSYKGQHEGGDMVTTEKKPDAGLTIKYGITSQMILDATINPDFSQVEADAGQIDVNLRYQLFYPEKRPFFQEGNENFQVGALTDASSVYSLVHTRNIVNPVAGVKLSGKIGARNSLSVMYAADRIPDPDDNLYGNYAHFPVMRFKRILKSDSYIGLIGTAVEKRNSSNLVYGADGQLRVNPSTLFEFHTILSSTDDTAAGVDNKNGQAVGLYLHSEKRNFDYSLSFGNVGEYFISQTGFVTRTGITSVSGSITPRIYPESDLFRKIDFNIGSMQTRDNIYDRWETSNSLSVQFLLGGTFRTTIRSNYSTEIYLGEKFNTSALLFSLYGRVGTRVNSTVAYMRRNAVYYPASSQGFGNVLTAELRYLPVEKLHAQINITYQDLFRESDKTKLYHYLISRGRVTYQMNKYLFVRAIAEYNNYRKSMKTDFLASFTYIPGTVFHIGYGSLYESISWDGSEYIESKGLMETKRGLFIKISYLFRL